MEVKLIDIKALEHYKAKEDELIDKKIKVETDRAEASEKNIKDDVALKATTVALTDEVTRAKKAEADIINTIDTERTERTTKDMELEGQINKNISDLANSPRVVDLDKEIARATGVENALRVDVDLKATDADLKAETARAKAEETRLTNELANKQQNVGAKLIDKDGVSSVMFEKPITALDVSGNIRKATQDYHYTTLKDTNDLIEVAKSEDVDMLYPLAGVDPSRDFWEIVTGAQVNKGSYVTHSGEFSAIVEEDGLYVGDAFSNLISNNPASGTGVDATYTLKGDVMTIVCTSDLVKSKYIVPFPDLAIKDATKYTLSWEVIEGEQFFDDVVINGANPPLTHIKDKKGSVTFERRSGTVDSSIHLTQASKIGYTVKMRLSLTETDHQVPFVGGDFDGGIVELPTEYRDAKYPKLYVNVDGTDYIEVGGKTVSFVNSVEGTAVVPSSYEFIGILMAFKEGTTEAKMREYLKRIKDGNYDVPDPMKGAYANIPRSTYKRGEHGSVETVATVTKGIPLSEKGAHNGVATLDSNGRLPSSQLPAGVDEIVEFADKTAFPATGAGHIIYLALDTNHGYRWSGSTYIELSSSLALGETSGTAYSGLKGKNLRDEFDAEVIKTNRIKTDVMSLVDSERIARNSRDIEIESKISKNVAAINLKEDAIIKETGFNLEKSDSLTADDTHKLATAKAAKLLNDKIEAETTRAKAAEAGKIDVSDAGAPNGVATLGHHGTLDDAQLPKWIKHDAHGTSFAIGDGAGQSGQGTYAIAIGKDCDPGPTSHDSISIGKQASATTGNIAIKASNSGINMAGGHLSVTGGNLVVTGEKILFNNKEVFPSPTQPVRAPFAIISDAKATDIVVIPEDIAKGVMGLEINTVVLGLASGAPVSTRSTFAPLGVHYIDSGTDYSVEVGIDRPTRRVGLQMSGTSVTASKVSVTVKLVYNNTL